jgi:hypothetical protein
MGLTSRRSAVCAAMLLGFAWSASASAQAQVRARARTCEAEELRPHPGTVDPRRVTTAGGRVALVRPEGMRLAPTEATS